MVGRSGLVLRRRGRPYPLPVAKKTAKKTSKTTAAPSSKPASKPAPAPVGAKPGRARAPRAAREVDVRAERSDALPPPPRATFDDIIGHERPLMLLRAAITSQRLHHAWIFHGPRGVGKLTTALAFAGAILDPTTAPGLGGGLAPDPDSPVQRLIHAGTHPDLHVITKELARFSDDRQVRERKLLTIPKDVIENHLLRPATLAPGVRAHGIAGKVFIVDEAELLDRSITNAPTQNAILKTMEEPPPGTVIILVTSAEDRLLPTIRSRCQRVAFARLTPREMQDWLKRTPLTPPAAHRDWLLAFAEGSPGALVDAVEGGLGEWRARLEPLLKQADAGRYASDLGPAMAELIDQWAEAQASRAKNASKEAANHEGARLMLRVLAHHYRTALRNAGPTPLAERAACAVDALLIAERELYSNVRLVDLCEDLSIRLAEAMPGANLGALS